jgi:prepilin-type processing-associated H-X9-DG protein
MYRIIGTDGKEYGPSTAEEINSWIRQGRLNAQSKIKPEGSSEWKDLKDLTEFREALSTSPVGIPAPPVPTPSKTSRLAVASLVLGVLGMFSLGFTAIVGLILGIIALVKINRSKGQVGGLGIAIAGVVVSGMMFMMIPILAAMLLPALARAKSRAQTVQCMTHVKQLNLALIMYATDHNETFPAAESWCDLIKPYTGGSTAVFECPSQTPGQCAYALNAAVANKKTSEIGNPARTVLVFSSAEGWNKAGSRSLAVPHKHNGRNGLTLGFADGHAEIVSGARASSIAW